MHVCVYVVLRHFARAGEVFLIMFYTCCAGDCAGVFGRGSDTVRSVYVGIMCCERKQQTCLAFFAAATHAMIEIVPFHYLAD